MHNTINLNPLIACSTSCTDELDWQLLTAGYGYVRDDVDVPGLVLENCGGYQLPNADAYARRLAEEAEAWLTHVRTRARMKEETVVRKALSSLAFSLRHRAHDLAVPSKLTGTSKHQPALWSMVRSGVGLGTPLHVEEVESGRSTRPRLVVSYEGEELGQIQSKHVSWLRPLIPFGAGVYLVRLTGQEADYTLGVNVAFGRVGSAIAALRHALGHGDGAGKYGDGMLPDGARMWGLQPQLLGRGPAHQGDGADGVSQPPTPTLEEVIRFWRDEHGVLRMNVPHVKRHSPTGPEIGYSGSGPADAALSVLCTVTSREEAERWYVDFKHEVIAQLPEHGGAVTRASVRRWLAEKRNDR